ncbi:MAG: BCD family MFS transporter [Pseudomonadota bacterium]
MSGRQAISEEAFMRPQPPGSRNYFSWFSVARLGLVQMALGAIVVLTTSTINRVMVVELALAAVVPGALVGWHYAIQMSRPRWGYGADMSGDRTKWILGGIAVLAIGAVVAALSTLVMATSVIGGVAVSIFAFTLIGVGVGASGTNLLALLAAGVAPSRKSAAAAIVWIMMIFGFVLTAGVVGAVLDPFSLTKLLVVSSGVALFAFALAFAGIIGLEGKLSNSAPNSQSDLERSSADLEGSAPAARQPFREALEEVWREPRARAFTIFVFVSMLAYSAQDLILEPFAGLVHGFTPGESTSLSGIQNGGVLIGMVMTAIIGTAIGKSRAAFMQTWTIVGCVLSALSLILLGLSALGTSLLPFQVNVFCLGVSNGMFAVAAIGSMMAFASEGRQGREGTRLGLWGASQAIAFGLGGFLGAVLVDVVRLVVGEVNLAFSFVFTAEGIVFLVAALIAARMGLPQQATTNIPAMPVTESLDLDIMSEGQAVMEPCTAKGVAAE